MWKKPWTLKEGFLIGAGLIVTGLLLELTVGAVDWDVFAWPTNIIVLAVFVLLIIAAYCCRSKVYAFRFLGTFQAAVPALAYAVALTQALRTYEPRVRVDRVHFDADPLHPDRLYPILEVTIYE